MFHVEWNVAYWIWKLYAILVSFLYISVTVIEWKLKFIVEIVFVFKLSSVSVWLFCFALFHVYLILLQESSNIVCFFFVINLFDRHCLTVILYENKFDSFFFYFSCPLVFFNFYMLLFPLWQVLLTFFCSWLRKSVDIVWFLWVFLRLFFVGILTMVFGYLETFMI